MAAGRELPDDLIADVLRRLPPRSLAVSRCVCRSWRDVVDARRLLRADLLPLSVGGIYINFCALDCPEFLSRPTAAGPSISGDLDFIQGISTVEDHCNGLLLIAATRDDYVANPATRRWDWLPPCPVPPRKGEEVETSYYQIKCLAYDPTLSPHYEVFLIPPRLYPENHQQSKWPPSSYALRVFSSMAGCWEERSFVLEGGEQREDGFFGLELEGGRVIDKLYWREALYVLFETGSGLRISMSNAKYRTIQKPSEGECEHHVRRIRLGISEKGVYCAFQYDWQGLGIFLLSESSGGQLGWELKQLVDLRSFGRKLFRARLGKEKHKGPWVLQDINYYKYPYGNNEHEEVVEGNLEWDSDDDDLVEERHFESYTPFLGFHPCKEIVFLNVALRRAVAYHWNTSKFQDLGNICPKGYLAVAGHCAQVEASFIYTPCWMDGCQEDNLEARIEDCHGCTDGANSIVMFDSLLF